MYTQTNVEKRRPYTITQWYKLCEQSEHQPPNIGSDRTTRPTVTSNRKRDKVSNNNNEGS